MSGSSLLQGSAWMIIAGVVSWLFARAGTREVVATRARVAGRPEQIWDGIMFYEDVPGRPAFPLRALLPAPVRTDGDKSRVGATEYRLRLHGSGSWPSASPPPEAFRICCNSTSSSSVSGLRDASSHAAVRPRFTVVWRATPSGASARTYEAYLAPPARLNGCCRPAPLALRREARRPFADIHTAARRPLICTRACAVPEV